MKISKNRKKIYSIIYIILFIELFIILNYNRNYQNIDLQSPSNLFYIFLFITIYGSIALAICHIIVSIIDGNIKFSLSKPFIIIDWDKFLKL